MPNEAQYELRYIFEHKLSSDYYSLDCGGADGHEVKSDFIYALSMNGELSVFQNETRVFQVHMPDMLFPSPLVYSSLSDAIYIQSRAMVISSFAQAFTGLKWACHVTCTYNSSV